MKRRAKLDSAMLDEYFAIPQPKKIPPYDLLYPRKTYRIAVAVHESLKKIAQDHGVGLNELVRWILMSFVKRFEEGKITLPIEQEKVVHRRLTE